MSTIADVLKLKHRELKAKDGSTDGPLEGIELLSLYFSAHWCPPCRGFTPQLASCYEAVNAKSKRWEIVFVPHDRTAKDFDSYFASMPWLSLHFDLGSDDKEDLCTKHDVRGIPLLVFIDPKDGSVLTKDGRGIVGKDLEGKGFPWK